MRFAGIHHLKYAVGDLAAGLDWWERAFDAVRDPALDHAGADGRPYGYILAVPGVPTMIELREDPEAAAAQRGFDPITLAVDTRDDLVLLGARWDARGLPHSRVLRGLVGWLLVIRSPDDLFVRVHTRESHDWDPVDVDTDAEWLPRARS